MNADFQDFKKRKEIYGARIRADESGYVKS
jgi:hypothetical protein